MTTAVFLGDSFALGVGAIDAAHSYCMTTGALLGWTVTVGSGMGYIGETPPATSYSTYINALIASGPDVVVVQGGHHDSTQYATAEALRAAADALFATLKAGVPRVIVVSPSNGSAGWLYGHDVAPMNAIVSAAASAAALPFVDWMSWITGTGYEGHLMGDGNADVYIGPDTVHPTQAGHDYLGTRLAFAIQPSTTHLAIAETEMRAEDGTRLMLDVS